MKDDGLLRRDFMRWIAAAGASTTLPVMTLVPRSARSASSSPAPLLVSFQAYGAYDTTLICDPRGNDGSSKPPNLGYAPADIKTFGNLVVAPQFPCVVDFFATYYQNTLVVNGVDTNTIDHGTGMRSSMSGYASAGYPVTGALAGAVLGGGLPAPFMSNAGTNAYTANVVGMTQLGNGISDALLNPMDGGAIHRPEVWVKIRQAMVNRLSREYQNAVATQRSQHLKLMQEALTGADALSQLTTTIAALSANVPRANPNSTNLTMTDENLALNIRVGLSGYLHGQTVALQFADGGFDSHGGNDGQQSANCQQLFPAIDYLLRCASYLSLNERILVFVASDFGRAPYYNSAQGKDHWPTTSVLFINPARNPSTPVNTVIGVSDATLSPVSINPKTLRPDSSGVHIQPGHIHDALRRHLGIATNPLVTNYDLHMNETMPLLG